MDKDKTEPSLVPEWLKNSGSGNATGGGTTSSSLSDDQGVSKPARNKSSVNITDHDSVRSPGGSDRTTSSYLRRNSSSNGSSTHARSYSSFGRSQRDRDWGDNKDIYKEKSVFSDYRPNRDYSDPLGNILPTMFDKDRLRRSQSSISGNRGDHPWPRKVAAADLIKNNHRNGNTVIIRGANKASFEREFPSLGTEERQADTEIKRVPSPVLSSTIQNLPIGSAAVIGGDGWTSALAEVPVMVASSNGSSGSVLAASAPPPAPASVASSPITASALNMAETVAQGPSRVQTAPQLSVGTQRLEELALKQSRQLIPVITSVPKAALVLNTSADKSKAKMGPQQHQISSVNHHSPRGGPAKQPDLSKPSTMGKLQVLKPARERNGISPAANSSSPTNAAKSPNSPLSVAPSAAPLRSPGSNPLHPSAEKRPTPNAQSRHDFFNLVRKKSMTNSSSATTEPTPAAVSSPPVLGEMKAAIIPPQDRDNPVLDRSSGTHNSEEDGSEKFMSNGKILIPYTEEEEVTLLRSMGWDENSGEEEGLTEEEINAFRSKYANSKPSAKVFPRMGSPKSDQDR